MRSVIVGEQRGKQRAKKIGEKRGEKKRKNAKFLINVNMVKDRKRKCCCFT